MDIDWTETTPFVRCLREKRAYNVDDSNVDDVIEGKRNFNLDEKLHDEKFTTNGRDLLLELEGKEFTLKYVQQNGFNNPILFKNKDGLELRVPNAEMFSVNDVKSYVGARRIIDVFDCDTHSPEKMSVHQFVRYYMSEEKDKLLNVTSLEFSQTGLDRLVDCPLPIREDLDWVSLVWPKHLINEQKDATNTIDNMKYPKVRKYCLMSVAGCYTDFHIDFGGSSVWYHVLKGSKVFWLIPPTESNLEAFEGWALSGGQHDVFFGDSVDDCFRIQLVAGDTFMIPTGWIHAVYTPDDSLVFGGNYLHSFNIPMQLRVFDIEEATHVPRHLRFPFFAEIHWYIVKSYLEILERDMDERRKLEFEADDNEPDTEDGLFKLFQDELGDDFEEKNENKTKYQPVHLTVFELDGLKLLCERLRSWSHAKLNYPKSLNVDSMELLDQLEELLQHHEDDDQILACNGVNIFKQFSIDTSFIDTSFIDTSFIKQEVEEEPNGDLEETNASPMQTSSPESSPVKKAGSSPLKNKESPIKKTEGSPTKKTESSPAKKHASSVVKKVDFSSMDEEEVPLKKLKSAKPKTPSPQKRQRRIKIKEEAVEPKEKRVKYTPKKYAGVKDKTIIRRVRCHQCEGCSRDNCNECRFCLDMKKNGGEGKLRQSCAMRFCEDPQLPSYVVCNVCNDRFTVEGFLMECSACAEVVHPSCITTQSKKSKKQYCKVSKKVANSWECPKCCQSDDGDKIEFSVTAVEAIVKDFKKENKHPTTVDMKKVLGRGKASSFGSKVILNKMKLKKSQQATDKKSKPSEKAESDSSDDDEPLIKKRNRKQAHENGSVKPLPIINIVKPSIVVRPAPIDNFLQHCYLDNQDVEKTHCLPREMWIHVFTYLKETDINKCMLVCKAWNQWCLDNRLWKSLEVSNKPLNPSILKGIVRRQPLNLVLTSTNATAKQIEWLLNRLPRLASLDLSLNTASAVSALLHVRCPPLTVLNLSWCDAIFDRFMWQILGPIRNGNQEANGLSRLHFVENLNLTGCDIAYETMKCVFAMLPSLRHLDLSHCTKVKDKDFEVVKSGKNVNKNSLKRIICQGCPLITETLVQFFMSDTSLPALVVAL